MKIIILLFIFSIKGDDSTHPSFTDEKYLNETLSVPSKENEQIIIQDLAKEIQEIQNKEGIRNNTKGLEKDFDIKNFLDNFDKFECENSMRNIKDQECEKQFKREIFDIIGKNDTNANDFYKHLKNLIHQPLGIEIKNGLDYKDLQSLLIQSNQSNLFLQTPMNINFKTFQKSILESFMDISGRTSDVDGNKEAISQQIISILKKCHIYWNAMRSKDQVEQAIEDTKVLVKNMAKFYTIRNDMLQNISKILFQQLKNAFYRFKRADSMFGIIQSQSASIISEKMIKRYVNQIERIKAGTYDYVFLNRELSYQMDLFITYMVMNYYAGFSQPQIRQDAENSIINRTIQSYNAISNYVQSFDEKTKKDMKEFTVILLLKFKHFIFIVLNLHAIPNFALVSDTDQVVNRSTTVIVLEELQNNLMLIPKTCVNFFILKTCTLQETNRILNYVTGKFMLKRSMSGWRILNYIEGVLKFMFSEANNFVWQNFYAYKQFFYQNLFLAINNISNHFMIHQDDSMNQLDEMLGDVIREAQKDLANINMKLIDIFDLQLYEEILKIKGKFNVNVPYNKDALILAQIQNTLHLFLQNFQNQYGKNINHDFLKFLKVIKDKIEEWKTKQIQGGSLPINPATLPLTAKSLQMKIVHQDSPHNLQSFSDHDVNQALLLEKLNN